MAKMNVERWDEMFKKKKYKPTTQQGCPTETALLGKTAVEGKRHISTVLRTVLQDSVP